MKLPLDEFLDRHDIIIRGENRNAPRHPNMEQTFFQDVKDYNVIINGPTMEYDKRLIVEVYEGELMKLMRMETLTFNHQRAESHYRMFDIIMQLKEQEQELKDAFPAVKKAYEQYSLMLSLAKSGKL